MTVSRLQRVQDLCCPPRFGPNDDNLSPPGRVISFVRDLPGAEETGNWIAVLSYEVAP